MSKTRVFFGSLEYEEEGAWMECFAQQMMMVLFQLRLSLNPSACRNRIECNQGNVFGNGEDDVYFKWDDASSECIYLDEKHPAYQNCRDCSCGNNDPFLCKLLGEDSCTYKPIDICSFTYEAKAQNLNGSVIKTCPPRINVELTMSNAESRTMRALKRKRGNRNEGVKGMCIAATQAPTNAPTEKPGPQLACRMLSTKAKCNQFSRLGCKFKNGKCDLDLKLAAKVYPSPTCTLGENRCVEVKYFGTKTACANDASPVATRTFLADGFCRPEMSQNPNTGVWEETGMYYSLQCSKHDGEQRDSTLVGKVMCTDNLCKNCNIDSNDVSTPMLGAWGLLRMEMQAIANLLIMKKVSRVCLIWQV